MSNQQQGSETRVSRPLLMGSAIKGNEYLHSMVTRTTVRSACRVILARLALGDLSSAKPKVVQQVALAIHQELGRGGEPQLVDAFVTQFGGLRFFTQHIKMLIQSDMALVGSALFVDGKEIVEFDYDGPQVHDLIRSILQAVVRLVFGLVSSCVKRLGSGWRKGLTFDSLRVEAYDKVHRLLSELVDVHSVRLPGEVRSRVAGSVRIRGSTAAMSVRSRSSRASGREQRTEKEEKVAETAEHGAGSVGSEASDTESSSDEEVEDALFESIKERQRRARELAKAELSGVNRSADVAESSRRHESESASLGVDAAGRDASAVSANAEAPADASVTDSAPSSGSQSVIPPSGTQTIIPSVASTHADVTQLASVRPGVLHIDV